MAYLRLVMVSLVVVVGMVIAGVTASPTASPTAPTNLTTIQDATPTATPTQSPGKEGEKEGEEGKKEKGTDRFFGSGGSAFGGYDSAYPGSSLYPVSLGGGFPGSVLPTYPGSAYPGSSHPGSVYPGSTHPGSVYPGGSSVYPNIIPSHGGYFPVPGQGCKYYCPWSTENIPYCCDNSPSYTGYLCPPVRYTCPHSDRHLHTPQYCADHRKCPLGQRCCFDACARGHVCKKPL